MYIPRGVSHREEFFAAIEEAAKKVPGVVGVKSELSTEWDGEDVALVRVTLSPDVPENERRHLKGDVIVAIHVEVQPLNDWGVHPLIYFTARADRADMKDLVPA